MAGKGTAAFRKSKMAGAGSWLITFSFTIQTGSREREQEVGPVYKPSKPEPSDIISSTQAPPPKDIVYLPEQHH